VVGERVVGFGGLNFNPKPKRVRADARVYSCLRTYVYVCALPTARSLTHTCKKETRFTIY